MSSLQNITLTTLNNTIFLPIAKPSLRDEYIVTDVKGVSDPSVSVNLQPTLLQGSFHMGSRANEREITLTIRLNPDRSKGRTIRDLRNDFYKHVLAGVDIRAFTRVVLNTPVTAYTADAQVSQIESDLYSKTPTIQISLLCKSAYFSATNKVVEGPVDVQGDESAEFTIDNPGAPVYFKTWISHGNGMGSSMTVDNLTTGQQAYMNEFPTRWKQFAQTFEPNSLGAGMDLREASRDFFISFIQNGTTFHTPAYDLVRYTNGMPHIASGKNVIRVRGNGFSTYKVTLEYTPRIWGI